MTTTLDFCEQASWKLAGKEIAINSGNSGSLVFNSERRSSGNCQQHHEQVRRIRRLGLCRDFQHSATSVAGAETILSGIERLLAEGNFARATNLPQSAGVLVPRISSGPDGEVINSHPALAYWVVTAVGHLPISRHSLSPTTALGIEETTSGYLWQIR